MSPGDVNNTGSPPHPALPIAVFDSGVGGLTVLHEFLVSLPSEDFVYLGDTAYFPYGMKPAEDLQARVALISRLLLDRGTKLLVIACNAATSAAREGDADHGRQRRLPAGARAAGTGPRRGRGRRPRPGADHPARGPLRPAGRRHR